MSAIVTMLDLRAPAAFGVEIQQQVSLAPYTTMKVGGPAEYFATVTTVAALIRLVRWARASAATPGVEVGENATVRLDLDNEVQPDAHLRLLEGVGGTSHLGAADCIDGAPELIVEIAISSASYDYHVKRRIYRRNGVREYLI